MSVCTETKLSQFEFKNRFDAELYRPDLKHSFDLLEKTGFRLERLRNHFIIRSGTTPSDRIDGLNEGPILFKTTDIRNDVISTNGNYYHISKKINDRMFKTKLVKSDVLLNIVGATLGVIGRSAYVAEVGNESANITQAMVLLRSKSDSFLPGYLFSFLNTKFAQDQIARYARPTGQYNLNLQEVGHLVIPFVNVEFQNEIQVLTKLSFNKNECSRSLYTQAQELLEKELRLDKLVFSKKLFSISSLEEVIVGHRLDSQHYQEKFDILLAHLIQFKTASIRKLRLLNRRGLQPKYIDNGPVNVVNSQHITSTHLAYNDFEKTSLMEFEKSKVAHIQKDDVLIYTTGAYIGQTNLYDSEQPAMASNHVNILRVKDIDSGYLSIILSSIIGAFQTEKYSRGSAQAELYPSDIDKFVIPLLDDKKQKEIGNLLRASLTAKKESELLLARAKKQVEELIKGAAQ